MIEMTRKSSEKEKEGKKERERKREKKKNCRLYTKIQHSSLQSGLEWPQRKREAGIVQGKEKRNKYLLLSLCPKRHTQLIPVKHPDVSYCLAGEQPFLEMVRTLSDTGVTLPE